MYNHFYFADPVIQDGKQSPVTNVTSGCWNWAGYLMMTSCAFGVRFISYFILYEAVFAKDLHLIFMTPWVWHDTQSEESHWILGALRFLIMDKITTVFWSESERPDFDILYLVTSVTFSVLPFCHYQFSWCIYCLQICSVHGFLWHSASMFLFEMLYRIYIAKELTVYDI